MKQIFKEILVEKDSIKEEGNKKNSDFKALLFGNKKWSIYSIIKIINNYSSQICHIKAIMKLN